MLARSSDYALAAASGVLLALSFPRFGHPVFGWIALVPILVALSFDGSPGHGSGLMAEAAINHQRSGQTWRHPFLLGLTTGVVYFTGTLYWITQVMVLYGDLQWWVAVLVNAALIAYLALFPAFFAIVMRRIVRAHGPPALMAAPVVWVASELGRTYLLTGFPWVLLGYSQVSMLPIAQLASLVGVYGVSALVASASAAAAMVAINAGWRPAGVVGAAVIAVTIWGSVRVRGSELTRMGDPVRVGLLQGNVDQAEKTDPARAQAILATYLGMTRQAIGAGAELVIWPESSTPFLFEEDRASAGRIRAVARQARIPILFGSDQVEFGPNRLPLKYYNSAFLVRADGTDAGVYRKMHLVPFGEYVPLKRLLFFAAPLVEAVGPFSAGEDAVLLPVGAHPVSVAICYEVVYPNLVRQFVRGGSELLTTMTNDAWFGRTSAPYQHFAQASMRAIEEGRYLVRSANTGISGIVDPYGRVLARSDIYQPAVIVGDARFLRASTFYARHGDLVAYASLALTVLLVVVPVRARRRVK